MGGVLRWGMNPALGRRPGTPQAVTPSGARDRQSDLGSYCRADATLGGTARSTGRRPTLWRATRRFFLVLWIELSDDKGECPKKGNNYSRFIKTVRLSQNELSRF